MILLDTHIVLWLAFEPKRLSVRARDVIQRERASNSAPAISSITLLELAILGRKGRFHYNASVESFLGEVERKFHVLPITARACGQVLQLPPNYPRDPVDRLIGATALAEGAELVTADQAIRRSRSVPTIW